MNFPFETPLERLIRESREKQEAENRKKLLSGFLGLAAGYQSNPYSTILGSGLLPTKRNVFISYHHGDDAEVKTFIKRWTEAESVFTPKGLGLRFTDDIIKSDNPEYVMSQIRAKYIQDASVTIVLLGTCTHSRRYVDWEIKASLRQEKNGLPNGLLGIILPSRGNTAHLPERFAANWTDGHINCYARFWVAPSSATELRGWIEDAYSSRTKKAHLIKNSADMMKNNATCQSCGYTHPA
ncbi:MAG: TIR domain-containing protein [Candidatus Omnitrophota bacterium]